MNKVAYCRATKRALYLFLGAPEPRALDARHDDLPWLDCREPPGNTLHIGKTLAFLALFHGPEPDSALYLDADAWLSDSAFAGDASPEALAPDAQRFAARMPRGDSSNRVTPLRASEQFIGPVRASRGPVNFGRRAVSVIDDRASHRTALIVVHGFAGFSATRTRSGCRRAGTATAS